MLVFKDHRGIHRVYADDSRVFWIKSEKLCGERYFLSGNGKKATSSPLQWMYVSGYYLVPL